MAALNFPTEESLGRPLVAGDTYSAPTNVEYVYDGVKWVAQTNTSDGEYLTGVTQDRVAPMFVNGNNTGITFSYDSETNVLTTVVTGGGPAGLPLANGTTNFDIATSNGNATITTAGAYTWTFDENSTLTLPGLENTYPALDFFSAAPNNHIIDLTSDWSLNVRARHDGANEGHLNLIAGQNTRVNINGSGSNVSVIANNGTSGGTWVFNADGKLTTPTVWRIGASDQTFISNDGFANSNDLWLSGRDAVFISNGVDGDYRQWMFSGNIIQIPDDGDIVRWNGSELVSVLGGGGLTDRLTNGSNSVILGSDGNLTIPKDIQDANGSVIFIEASDTAPTKSEGQLWFNSEDGRLYIKYDGVWTDASPTEIPNPETYLDGLTIDGTTLTTVDIAANVNIQSAGNIWTFDTNGVLNLPTGIGDIKRDGVSVLGINGQTDRLVNGAHSVILSDTGLVTFPNDSKIGNYPGSEGDGQSWFITPPNYAGGITSSNGEQFVQVDNNGLYVGTAWPDNYHEWSFGLDGNLTIPGGISKDGLTFTLDGFTEDPPYLIAGINDPETNSIIFGNQLQGLAVQKEGITLIQSRVDSEAPTIVSGSPGVSEGVAGGDVLIIAGYSESGTNGAVVMGGQYIDIETAESVNIFGPEEDYGWTFDLSDNALVFPDNTRQYTAYQGATIVSDTAPTDDLGRLWFNSVDGRAYVKYNDNWTDISPQVIPSPETYLDGLTIDDTTISKTNFPDSRSIVLENQGHTASLKSTGELEISGNFIPKVTASQDLGSTTMYWNEAYINQIHTVLDGGSADTWLTAS
jgi:hypothetical protein